MITNPITPRAYSTGFKSPAVRFGSWDQLGQTLVSALLNDQTTQKNEAKKKKEPQGSGLSKWFSAIAWNSIGLTALTGLFSNLDTFFKVQRQAENRMVAIHHNITLEKVAEEYKAKQAKEAAEKKDGKKDPATQPTTPPATTPPVVTPPVTPPTTTPPPGTQPGTTTPPTTQPVIPMPKPLTVDEWIPVLRTPDVILSSPDLDEVAKMGFIKQIYTADKNLQNAANITQWDISLADGTEVLADVSDAFRNKSLREMGIPIIRARNGHNMDLVKAGLLATMIMGMINGGVSMLKRRKPSEKLTPEEEIRVKSNELGRTIVAMELGVTKEPLEIEEVKQTMYDGKPNADEHPLTESDMRNRMIVNMAGRAAEEALHGNNPSIASIGAIRENSAIAYEIVMSLALGNTFKHYSPTALHLTDEQKSKAETEIDKLVNEATEKARTLINKYEKPRLEEARKGMIEVKKITDAEIKAILEGKSVEDIRADRKKKTLIFLRPFKLR